MLERASPANVFETPCWTEAVRHAAALGQSRTGQAHQRRFASSELLDDVNGILRCEVLKVAIGEALHSPCVVSHRYHGRIHAGPHALHFPECEHAILSTNARHLAYVPHSSKYRCQHCMPGGLLHTHFSGLDNVEEQKMQASVLDQGMQ